MPISSSSEIIEGISKHAFRMQYLFHFSDKYSVTFSTKHSGKKYNYDQEAYLLEEINSYWISDVLWSINLDYFNLTVGMKNMFNHIDQNSVDSEVLSTYDPGRRWFLNVGFSYQ